MSTLLPGKHSSSSRLSRLGQLSHHTLSDDALNHERRPGGDSHSQHVEIRSSRSLRPRAESSPFGASFSSLSYKTPARSYYQHSFDGSLTPAEAAHSASRVREDTAELASWALSEAASTRSETSPNRRLSSQNVSGSIKTDMHSRQHPNEEYFIPHSNQSYLDNPIEEVSEPVSPEQRPSSRKSRSASVLTEMIKKSNSMEGDNPEPDGDASDGEVISIMGWSVSLDLHEGSHLINGKSHSSPRCAPSYGTISDIESLSYGGKGITHTTEGAINSLRERALKAGHVIADFKGWDRKVIWRTFVVEPVGFVPAVALGLLLNILDALSYGMILFPLGQPIFENLGPDGISIFYVSCIVSQLVYSLGGSIFKGGIGSEMIEVVPFFHKMAFTILARIGPENPVKVLSTTVISYSVSSVLTGAVFYLMGRCRLGSLIGFFPRHILIGCIGGVGWFLVATGVEVSARLEGNLEYNLATIKELIEPEKVFLWTVPLLLAIVLLVIKRWVTYPLTDAAYFISIIVIFYIIVAAIPQLTLEDLRAQGWIFEAPEAGVPFYHFYTLFNFREVDWVALGSTVPAMFALTFFGVLHVPINIPALGITTGEDNVDVDRELRAHGWSNVLSGLCGSVQNYLVYTNTILFIRSGGESRVAGVLLAIGTFGILVAGPVIIGYVPVTVVAALIYFLGIDLLREALVHTWNRVHRLEYLTIIIIVVTMGAWDFVIGILIGVVLACVSFVLQTSQVSAIRGTLPGDVANSTVRRHPTQHRFLQEVGRQIFVMKLAGYLFFGTIVGVENRIRALLCEEAFDSQPIRFLVLDLSKVDGVDFSAAEAFTRVNRILCGRNVKMIMSGIDLNTGVGRSLDNIGLLNEEDGIDFFEDLNSALEHCENELLKIFYRQRDVLESSQKRYLDEECQNLGRDRYAATHRPVDIAERDANRIPSEIVFSSPRRHQLEEVAASTLQEQHDASRHADWRGYEQPLQLILQTFTTVSDKDEQFWRRAVSYFQHQHFTAGDVLYRRGDSADGFFLLETGILKAEYKLPQGKFSELIVAGTTCGELPFFSGTGRTSTTTAERECSTWMLDGGQWKALQKDDPMLAQELLKISLKLTSERMDVITKFVASYTMRVDQLLRRKQIYVAHRWLRKEILKVLTYDSGETMIVHSVDVLKFGLLVEFGGYSALQKYIVS